LKISSTGFYKDVAPLALGNIPKGFNLPARRCPKKSGYAG
jgi:hypothetical protein